MDIIGSLDWEACETCVHDEESERCIKCNLDVHLGSFVICTGYMEKPATEEQDNG